MFKLLLGTFRFLISRINQQTLAGQIKKDNDILAEFPVVRRANPPKEISQ